MGLPDSLLKQLASMSNAELAELRDRAAALLAIGPSKRAQEGGFVEAIYEALAEQLAKKTKSKSAPFAVFAGTQPFRETFLPAARLAEEHNRMWFPSQSRAEQLSMCALYAELVLSFLEREGRGFFWRDIGVVLSSLPVVVDQFFPGYAESGLLGKVQGIRCGKRA